MGRGSPILVIEDDRATLMLIQATLGDEGYEVLSASSVSQALRTLQETDVSLILLDVVLRGSNGHDFIEEYQRLFDEHAPVVVMTALDEQGEWPDLVVAHIPKPFDLDEFVAVVRSLTGD